MIPINDELASKLRYKFSGLTPLTVSYSQCGQDLFVLSMLNGKRNGTYIEIGCCYGEELNNTALLERDFAWTGIAMDIQPDFVADYNSKRTNQAILQDATTADYAKLLADRGITDNIIDYASVDCEPPAITMAALKQLPLDTHKIRVITFEHDCYANGDAVLKASREYLLSKGYELVATNISEQAHVHNFEDWWVHPELVDRTIIDMFKDDSDNIKFWADYLFPRT